MIVGGYAACCYVRPTIDRLLKACLCVGIVSETIKIFSVTDIMPVVEPKNQVQGETAELFYESTGQYAPYMKMEHLPLELCSLMIIFIVIALALKNEVWKEKILTLMYVTGVVGGSLGILLGFIVTEYHRTIDYFTAPRVWQYFLYHSMVLTMGLYLGFGAGRNVSIKNLKTTIVSIILLDIPTFYLNSIFSQAVYLDGKPVGLAYRTNFFSSYANPLGIVMSEKYQWFLYLLIRICIATAITVFLLWLPSMRNKKRGK